MLLCEVPMQLLATFSDCCYWLFRMHREGVVVSAAAAHDVTHAIAFFDIIV